MIFTLKYWDNAQVKSKWQTVQRQQPAFWLLCVESSVGSWCLYLQHCSFLTLKICRMAAILKEKISVATEKKKTNESNKKYRNTKLDFILCFLSTFIILSAPIKQKNGDFCAIRLLFIRYHAEDKRLEIVETQTANNMRKEIEMTK